LLSDYIEIFLNIKLSYNLGMHGRVMLSSTVGLNFSHAVNTSSESSRLNAYPGPLSQSDKLINDHLIYKGNRLYICEMHYPIYDLWSIFCFLCVLLNLKGADGRAFSGSTSGSPSQQWWNRVVVEGRLGDINRALAVLTYWPDLNWNSGLERNGADLSGTITEGIYGTQRGMGEMEMITLTVASITNSTLPVSFKVVRVRVHAANDAPVLSIPGPVYSDGSSSSPSSLDRQPGDPIYSEQPIGSTIFSSSSKEYHAVQVLTGDQLSPLVVDSLMIFIDEGSSATLHLSVRDVDCSDDMYLRITLTPLHGTISLRSQRLDPFDPFNGLSSLGLVFQEVHIANILYETCTLFILEYSYIHIYICYLYLRIVLMYP
jgi:hypothetical protein